MSNQSSNSAKQVSPAGALEIDEPSMDEILASIKKIISDDEEAGAALQDREQYSHPSEPSNSNQMDQVADSSVEAELEADLEAAIELELKEAQGEAQTSQAVETEFQAPEASAPEAVSSTPQAELQPTQQIPAASKPEGRLASALSAAQTMQERVEQIRNEVSKASSGLSVDDRLEKYRVRSKLKMETLAESKPKTPPAPQPAPPPVQPTISPAVAAGPVLPTTHTIAQEMARTMLSEKEEEIQSLLANMMRPSIRKWLNENLPAMVEKLVREEIERVSRGKQAS